MRIFICISDCEITEFQNKEKNHIVLDNVLFDLDETFGELFHEELAHPINW